MKVQSRRGARPGRFEKATGNLEMGCQKDLGGQQEGGENEKEGQSCLLRQSHLT